MAALMIAEHLLPPAVTTREVSVVVIKTIAGKPHRRNRVMWRLKAQLRLFISHCPEWHDAKLRNALL